MAPLPSFSIGAHAIENVLAWAHLGHIFNANLLNDDDILSRRGSFIGQTNTFLCNFSKVDISVRNKLFHNYCSSHYGAELWDLNSRKVEDYCIAWRKALRKVWKLPYDASSINVALVSNTAPLLDELCRRANNFTHTCLQCDSNFVQTVAMHGISAGARSPIGRNAVFCSLRFNMHIDDVGKRKLSNNHCFEQYRNKLNVDSVDRAAALRELIYVREGLYKMSNSDFCMDDINSMIGFLACNN